MALNTVTIVKMPDGRDIVIADWTDIPLYGSVDLASGFSDQDVYLFQQVAGERVPYAAQGLAIPPGGIVPREATENDTNLETAGTLDSEEEMLIYAIKPEVSAWGFTPLDFTSRTELGTDAPLGSPAPQLGMIAVLQARLMIYLKISEKLYAQAGFGYFNPGFGPFGVANLRQLDVGSPALVTANNGLPSQEAVRSFAIPHHIGGQEKFRVILKNAPGTPVNLGLELDTGEEGQTNNTDVMATVRVYLEGLRKRNTG